MWEIYKSGSARGIEVLHKEFNYMKNRKIKQIKDNHIMPTRHQQLFTKSMIGVVGSVLLVPGAIAANKKPNLLYIFPDQYRLHAMSIWSKPGYKNALRTVGDPVHTPNLDELAKKSVLFTQAVSTYPVCSPHRAMLMSGMYPASNGVDINCKTGRKAGLYHDIECFTDVLAKNGYETAYVGKTHWERNEPLFDKQFNYVGKKTSPGGYSVNSFDTFIPRGRGRHSNKYWYQPVRDNHFNPAVYSSVPKLIAGKKDGQPYFPRKFTPLIEANAIIAYLKNKGGERDANKPFSIIWAPNPPHSPYHKIEYCEKDIYKKYYKDFPIDKLLIRKNAIFGKNAKNKAPDKCAKIYFSLVTSVDRQIGRVLKELKESGLAENTIVIFTSDHGEMMGSKGLMAKNVIYDESFLVPFMICYPGKLKHRMEDLMLSSVDIMPTMLGLMDLPIPSTVQGVNYSKGLETGIFKDELKPKSALYIHPVRKGVRTDNYTYQVDRKGRTELYNNCSDPYQMKNLPLKAIPAKDLNFLQQELGRWLKKANDPWYKRRANKSLINYPETQEH